MIKLGRKPKFKTPGALQRKTVEYFNYCEENKEPVCITGLCVFLGVYRDYLNNLERNSKDFSNTVKRIKEKIAYSYEQMGLKGETAPAQAIFLQKNLGFTDKTEVKHEHTGDLDFGGVFKGINKDKK